MEIIFSKSIARFKVPVKFCKQNHTKRQGWLIPMVLWGIFICIDPRQMILPDRFKTSSLNFQQQSLSLNPISIRFRILEVLPIN